MGHKFPPRSMMEPHYTHSNDFEQQTASPYTADYHHQLHGQDFERMPGPLDFGAPAPENASYDLQELFDSYVASYNDDTTPASARMEAAKAFAEALLSHYYPESEGYIVQASDPIPMAKHGMNFMLKTTEGTDPEYHPLAPLRPPAPWKDLKKGKSKAKAPSMKTIVLREKKRKVEEYKRQFSSWWPYTTGVQWHFIEPKDISCFEVLKQHTTTRNGPEETELRLHTSLAIVLAAPDLPSRIADTNDVHRADILADALSRSRDVQRGHGMLLFGPWLELYDFNNGKETQVAGDDEEEFYEGMVSCEDPIVSLCRAPDGQGLALDMRTVGLETVEEVCGMVLGREGEVEMVIKNEEADTWAGAGGPQGASARHDSTAPHEHELVNCQHMQEHTGML